MQCMMHTFPTTTSWYHIHSRAVLLGQSQAKKIKQVKRQTGSVSQEIHSSKYSLRKLRRNFSF